MLGFSRDLFSRDSRIRSLIPCLLLLSPPLIAIWAVPWFVTQDGPIHLYNSRVLWLLGHGNYRLGEVYAPRGGLLPYTGTYRILEWLLLAGTPRFADRLMMTVTSVVFAGTIIWLRARIRGWESMHLIAPLILAVSFSRLWLYGLYGFFLGACVFVIALACWWSWRDDLGALRVAAVAVLLLLGFFFHIVGAALAVATLITLAILTPGTRIKARVIWTVVAIAPTAYLTARFVLSMRNSSAGGIHWDLNDALSIGAWLRYIQNADFISISFKSDLAGIFSVPTDMPFVRTPAYSYAVLSPFHWTIGGLALLVVSTLRGRVTKQMFLTSAFRGWALVGGSLLVAGFVGPGAFGQGSLFRERMLLLGIVIIAVLVRPSRGLTMKVAMWALLFAAVIQIAFVCDYASISNQIASQFQRAESHVGRNTRLAMITVNTQTQYLVTPIPQVINQVGLDTESVVWNNYGPAYYYFPVVFKDDRAQNRWRQIDTLNKLTIAGQAQSSALKNPDQWSAAFDGVLGDTDFLIVWGEAPWLESINSKWFDLKPFYEDGNLRLFKRK